MATNSSISIPAAHPATSRHDVDLDAHVIRSLPVIVISAHNQCNCRCVMCDIWRIRKPEEIVQSDLERHLQSFLGLGVRWVVFSGGEPQLNTQLPFLAQMLRAEGIHVTILTAGLLIESQAALLAERVDDVIVSSMDRRRYTIAFAASPKLFRRWRRAWKHCGVFALE